jgi:hypothetical protein
MTVVRAYTSISPGPPPTDAAQAFVLLAATTAQDNAVLEIDVNAALGALIRPRGETLQRLGIRISAELPSGRRALWGAHVVAWSSEESATGGTQWTLTTSASEDLPGGAIVKGPFGYEVDYQGAPPPGNGLVRAELVYDLPDGGLVPFAIFSGYSMESERTDDPEGGHRLTLTGMGGEAFFDRAVGEFQLPAGHGLTHGEVARGLLEAIGVPPERIRFGAEIGSPRTNPVDLPCAEGWPRAVEVMRAAGFYLRWDRSDPPCVVAEPLHGGL